MLQFRAVGSVEDAVIIECWSCRHVHPGAAKCDVCAGRGTLKRVAARGDAVRGHELLKEALQRAFNGLEGVQKHEALVEALVRWQLYGVNYVAIESKVMPESGDFQRTHQGLHDKLVFAIRKAEREI